MRDSRENHISHLFGISYRLQMTDKSDNSYMFSISFWCLLQDTLDEFLEIQKESDPCEPERPDDENMGSGWVKSSSDLFYCMALWFCFRLL